MADKRIPDYPTLPAAHGGLLLEVVDPLVTTDHPTGTSYKAELDALLAVLLPPGVVAPYAGSAAPAGWLLCDGSEVSQATYAALYAVVGATFGAASAGMFRLPDLRRRVPVGAGGTGTAALGNAVGDAGGAESVTLTAAQSGSPAHTHPLTVGQHTHGVTQSPHQHAATQAAHTHAVTDPGHTHGPGGNATAFTTIDTVTGNRTDGGAGTIRGSRGTTASAATGVTLGDATPAITVAGGLADVTINPEYSNVSLGASTATPAAEPHGNLQPSLVLNYLIKA